MPSFVFVGPQKTGSSWFDACLRESKEVALPNVEKEIFFFDRNFHPSIRKYATYFDPKQLEEGRLCGEIGPTYFDLPFVTRRIFGMNPECKIVVTVRDPVARAWSHYAHYYKKGYVGRDLVSAILKRREILTSGQYERYVRGWREAFGYQRVLLVDFERIRTEPEALIAEVCLFLGIQPFRPNLISEVIYGGSVPKYRSVAKLLTASANALRRLGCNRIIELGKRAGLGFFYSGGDLRSLRSHEGEAMLEEHYRVDREFIRDELGTVRLQCAH